MNATSKVPFAAAVAVAVLASCSGGGGGGGGGPQPPTPGVGADPAITTLIRSVPDPAAPAERDERSEVSRRQEPGFEVVRTRRIYSHGGQDYPVLAPHGDVIYPGADVQGRSLPDGVPDPITAPRGPGAIAITNTTGSALASVQLAEVGLASVTAARNQIIDNQPSRFPANLTVSIDRVRTLEELQIEVGASASYLGVFQASANFQFESRQDNKAFLVTLRQDFYSIAFERPSQPHDFYAPGVTLAQLAGQVGPDNPAGYVSEVTYGRVFYLLVQATDSHEQMQATLEANLQLGVFGGGASGGFRYLTDFHGLRVRAYAYGGEQENVLQSILGGMQNWLTLRDRLISASDLRQALPVSYKVRSLATDALIKNDVNADYTYEVRNALGPSVPTLLSPASGATLDNGCGVDPNPVDWTFDWSDVTGADRYQLEITNSTGGVFAVHETSNSQDGHRSIGALRSAGWSWRVRARIGGTWQAWSGSRGFVLEAANSDCQTGVKLWSHPNYTGSWIWIAVTAENLQNGFDLERLRFDDDMDSFQMFNLRGVTFYEDPLRAPWNGGRLRHFTRSSPNVEQEGFRANRASAGRFDLGLPF